MVGLTNARRRPWCHADWSHVEETDDLLPTDNAGDLP
jgi:hypothetical protein